MRSKYGFRIFKLPINANLSCPNRINGQGCIFCTEEGSSSPVINVDMSVTEQMQASRNAFVRTDVETKYIAYFQAYTNTFAPLAKLEELYKSALSFPDTIGMMIATRPDCITNDIAQLIASFDRPDFELWVELGMQSKHNRTLELLNRGHTHEETVKALKILDAHGLKSCVHVILGLPGENWHDMMQTALELQALPIRGAKIHHLHVIKDTPLADLYYSGGVQPLSFNQYKSTFCDFVERLPKETIIHRISGDAMEDRLIAPCWGHEKGTVQNGIIGEFRRRGTWQGFLIDKEEI